MVLVTIALETAEDEEKLMALLPTVHGRVVEKSDVPDQPSDEVADKRQRLKNAMDTLAKAKTAEKFGDASEWQRDVRSWDRVLDGREE